VTNILNVSITNMSIKVVYFRTGYTPDAYQNEDAWKARLIIEKSTAIVCFAYSNNFVIVF
jgi:hypothetical protein